MLGPHNIDRFLTNYSNICRMFNYRWWVPGTEAISALNQTWCAELNWLVPPPKHIMSCLKKLALENARGTLIIPNWQSAPFRPFITALQNEYKYFVKGAFEFPKSGTVCKGKGRSVRIYYYSAWLHYVAFLKKNNEGKGMFSVV